MATDEVIEGEIVEETTEVTGSTALMALTSSEINQQIATARQFPRKIKEFKNCCRELATLDEDTAGSMFYVLPGRRGKDGKKGKPIEGPSIRMAEIVAYSWKNLRSGARITAEEEKFVVAQGFCFDVEKNIAASIEVKRRITTAEGKRFGDDMVQVTCRAACSIAAREAIFKVVPRAMWMDILAEAKLASVGKATTMAEKRHKALEWFCKAGAEVKDVLAFLGRAGLEEITLDDLVLLRGLVTAIKDGETTVESALAPPEGEVGSKARKSDLNDRVKGKAEPAKEAAVNPAPAKAASWVQPYKTQLGEAHTKEASKQVYDAACGPEGYGLDTDEMALAFSLYTKHVESLVAPAKGKGQKKLMETHQQA